MMDEQLDGSTEPTAVVHAYWYAIGHRDWLALRALLSDDVVYEVPQTRERVRGVEAVIRFNAEYPGDWTVAIERVVADPDLGASWISFLIEGVSQPGITFFDFDAAGRIDRITDFWPEEYAPPNGRSHLVERY